LQVRDERGNTFPSEDWPTPGLVTPPAKGSSRGTRSCSVQLIPGRSGPVPSDQRLRSEALLGIAQGRPVRRPQRGLHLHRPGRSRARTGFAPPVTRRAIRTS